MKFLIALCVLALVALSSGKPRNKRCIYIEGRCAFECRPGTYSYTPGCGPITPEPTCDNPEPVEGRGAVCDYSSCYCNPPTVKDKATGKCVKLEECTKNSQDVKPVESEELVEIKPIKPIRPIRPTDKN